MDLAGVIHLIILPTITDPHFTILIIILIDITAIILLLATAIITDTITVTITDITMDCTTAITTMDITDPLPTGIFMAREVHQVPPLHTGPVLLCVQAEAAQMLK